MKQIKYYSIAMILFCLIVAGCNETVKQEAKTPSETADSFAEIAAKASFAAPIGNAEYEMLRRSAFYAFTYPDTIQTGYYSYPKLIEPRINLNDFENYVNAGNYEGIRIYPGYDMANKHLVFIMCQANISNSNEANYIAFPAVDYSGLNTMPQPGALNEVQPYHDNYFRKIRILFQDQNNPDTTLIGKIRFSRFYRREEINLLIRNNLKDMQPPYAGYKIKLEFGYIVQEIVQNLQGRIQDETYSNDELQGFTSILYLIDDNDQPMLEADSIYRKPKPDDPNNYYRLYLEVGSPCPPVCGELHND